jgi:hypothetical protein
MWRLRGACALGHALAVADLVRFLAFALLGIARWERGESWPAFESARVATVANGLAVRRVRAMRSGGGGVNL